MPTPNERAADFELEDRVSDLGLTAERANLSSPPMTKFPPRHISRWYWLLLWLSSAALLPAQTPAPRVFRDVPYVTGGTERQRLNLFLPPAAPGAGKVPLIVNIHGGGWHTGSKEQTVPDAFLAHGYAVASIDYRLCQDAVYPAQIEDCKAAVRWLRANASEYGIDPARIGVKGESAGGHLAALLGTTGQTRRFDVGENFNQSSAVVCVLDRFGIADFLHWGTTPGQTIQESSTGPYVVQMLGGPVREHEDLAHAASPIEFVDAHSAPFLILHGDKDTTVPLSQSQLLDAALKKAGVESTLIVVPGGGHNGPAFSRPELTAQTLAFFDKHMK